MRRFLVLAVVCLATPAAAEHSVRPAVVSNGCNPAVLFKSLNPVNFIDAMNGCAADDIAAAIALAQVAPSDDVALSCLMPLQGIATSKTTGGLLTAFEAFRRAKMSGFVSACTAWATSIPLLP